MEEFKNMLHQIGQLYQNLSKRQRIVIAASIVVVIGFLVFLALYKGIGSNAKSNYAVLVENTDASNTAAIVTRLDQAGVPYILQNENTILVPQDQVYKQKMMVASEGLIKDSKMGWEGYDQQQFGATSEDQRIKYLRAIQTELARTIESLEPIQRANVFIAIPKDSVFTERQIPPTASVVLNIKEGLKLTPKQIDGIKNIVASAVPKLDKENVKITDQKGVPLEEDQAYESDLIATQIRYKRDREQELEQKIINTLAPFVGGTDKVVANVNIDFDFSQMESQSEVYDPNTVVRSEQTLNEERRGFKDPTIQGVPGAVSNISPVEGLQDNTSGEFSTKNQTTTNNEISKTVTNTKKSFATILRTSAAVMIDGKYQESINENGEVVTEYIPLSDTQLQNIQNLVQRTINYDVARGDSVAVSNLEFAKSDVKVESKVKTFYGRFIEPFIPPIKYFIAAILLFIFYKKVIVPFTQKMLADVAAAEEQEQKDAGFIEDAEDALEKFNAARKRVEEQLGFGDNINEDALQYDVLLEKLKALVNDKSQEVATLLQTLVENDSEYNEHKDI
ncbi:flagellar basal-body MS-ring/collar protein FliF [Campylobacter sp. MIT 97-5078]|uniref:flagellar basal-body MS-ring/collar protein FliF n=1 Tax=Campylobacter sp. MIT 97-5078 TaxID=1548153 RepID=UPI000513FF99|nr:flagellar basal-body MS-ring/collar protein FliF [Campylobacter sp. MIT 97-5078]KGI56575.1 flagellar M-ring protein FliF [Campylobacter sp. MIT 97-5078]TQR26767.1 flagellar basal body M-ring protein FliF [Campylobacter sp. MIT 97-5078]